MRHIRIALLFGFAVLLAACGEEESQSAKGPPPVEPTREAIGHYCGMIVVDHPGPKGQIYLEGSEAPLWFSSVRDTLAFTMLPEEQKNIAAIYVNDMAKANDWNQPEAGTWVDAREAVFIVGSDARGGMGASEAVPFSDPAAAENFAQDHGGQLFSFGEVPEHYILGPAEPEDAEKPAMGGMGHTGDDGREAQSHD